MTKTEIVRAALTERNVNFDRVRFVNHDPWAGPTAVRKSGWLARINGQWVSMGRSVQEALRYANSL